MDVSNESTDGQQQQEEIIEMSVSKIARVKHIARCALTPFVAAGTVAAFIYAGYEFANEAANSDQLFSGNIDQITVALGAVAGGILGIFTAIEIAPAIAGNKPQPQFTKPENIAQQTTE